jgi:hypothetical protein
MQNKLFSITIEGEKYTRHRVVSVLGKKLKFKVLDLPEKVRLDVCTLCQLKCLTCYMRVHDSCGRGNGYEVRG